jgi:hypothetical protein
MEVEEESTRGVGDFRDVKVGGWATDEVLWGM